MRETFKKNRKFKGILDKQNPFTPQYHPYSAVTTFNTSARVINELDKQPYTLGTGLSDAITPYGRSIKFDNTTNAYVRTGISASFQRDITVIVDLILGNSAADEGILGDWTETGGASHFQIWKDEFTTDRIGIAGYNGAFTTVYTSGITITTGTRYIIGVTKTAAGASVIYVNGVPYGSGTLTIDAVPGELAWGTFGSKTSNSNILFGLIDTRVWSPEEVFQYSNDLYQIFKPAGDFIPYVASGFQPAWASRANSLI